MFANKNNDNIGENNSRNSEEITLNLNEFIAIIGSDKMNKNTCSNNSCNNISCLGKNNKYFTERQINHDTFLL